MRPVRAIAAAVLGLALIGAAPMHLQSNRAIYSISLEKSRPGEIASVHGRTVVEFRVTCSSYNSTQRFIADMSDAQNNVSRSDFAITASEARNGRAMRFDIKNMVDGQIVELFKGSAEIGETDAGHVSLTLPEKSRFELPQGTLLPTMQTIAIIAAAEEGKRAFNSAVYQGGDKKYLYYSTATIGRPFKTGKSEHAMLKGVTYWPVLLSFYPSGQENETPDYEIAAHLYANGILSSMSMIYPRFTLKAKLVKLERLPTPKCK